LKDLKTDRRSILVHDTQHPDYPYDIIEFIDMEGVGIYSKKDSVWSSLIGGKEHTYDDIEVLDLFSHFCFVERPTV